MKATEILKYVLAVAVGSFIAGVGTLEFMDARIQAQCKCQEKEDAINTLNEQMTNVISIDIGLDNKRSTQINGPQMGGNTDAICPEGYVVVGVRATGSVGGKYAVDGISRITVDCARLRLIK